MKHENYFLRIEKFEEVVEHLLANHNDSELNAKFAKTTGGITDVALDAQELRRTADCVAWIVKKATLKAKTYPIFIVIIGIIQNKSLFF